ATIATVPGLDLASHVVNYSASIHLKQAVARDHLNDPHVATGIELGAKGFLEHCLQSRYLYLFTRTSGHEFNAVRQGI
ncbi:UNVERIFIED_CONTAM: hypothetical protein IGO34_36860, partial [Salmonella enterica subsp. enterica serovar Weltevreden]